LAAAFPKVGIAGFAWAAPGIILGAAVGTDGRQAFRLGYLGGLTYFLVALYWLLNIPVFKLLPLSAWLALSAFLSVYTGGWVWLCWRVCPGGGAAEGWEARSERLLGASWGQRAVWTLSCAALWVAWEMIQARLFTGFPWNALGASQYRMLPLIQVASWTGVYGVSFLAVWFSVAGLAAVVYVMRRSHQTRRWFGELLLPLLTVIAVLYGGLRQVLQPPASENGPSLKLALVQPSIPQRWIWTPEDKARRFEQLLELSERALTNRPQVLVWPEAATPGFIRWETNLYQTISNFVQRHQVWLVLGGDDLSPRQDDPGAIDVYNSSFLLNPRGEIQASYRKRRLVIFGEYLPLHRWFPFLERWTGMGSFTEGREPVPFRIPEWNVKTSVLICFEDNFPHHTREYVDPDTDFLLNLTNNGWFGESAAQWQHAASAIFRAVENRVPLVRCANNGLTCQVGADGRLAQVYFPGTTDIYGVGVKVVEVPLLAGHLRAPTFYRRFGDVFGWGCVGWGALVAGENLWRTARQRRQRTSGDVAPTRRDSP
jgi:apolipoprotein N-acyltransferase